MEIALGNGGTVVVDGSDGWLREHRWTRTRRGYAQTTIDGKKVYLHRLLFPGAKRIDHRNGDGLDNRRENLRPCTQRGNKANSLVQKNNRSGFKGVRVHRGTRWVAHIKTNGRNRYLGSFGSREDAARAYDEAARREFGEFACLNFPASSERGCRGS